jgi:hypothetical protein
VTVNYGTGISRDIDGDSYSVVFSSATAEPLPLGLLITVTGTSMSIAAL